MAELREIPSNIAGTIEARRSASLGWRRCICELVDNSIDADARAIHVRLSKSRGVTMRDDGSGIEDILKALTDGETTKKGRHKIGRWGVGLKDAAMWTAIEIRVRSVCGKKERTGSMDFDECIRHGKFEGMFEDRDSVDPSCTEITMHPLLKDRRLPSRSEADSLARDLSFIYHPFISENSTIRLFLNETEVQIHPFRRPRLDPETIEFNDQVGGKSFSVTAGVVTDGEPNPHPGFHLVFGKRVIADAKTDRASGQYAIGRFFGEIRLGEGWILERNKDNVFESRLLDELYDVVLARCGKSLAASDTRGTDIRSKAVESELTRWLAESTGLDPTGVLGEEKRPGPHTTEGTVNPKGTGARRRQAENVLDMPEKDVRKRHGSKNSDKRPKGYVVKFDRLPPDIIGDTKALNPIVVLLNADHPWVKAHRGSVDTLKAVTSALIATHTVQAEQWQNDFRRQLSRLLADPTVADASLIEGAA